MAKTSKAKKPGSKVAAKQTKVSGVPDWDLLLDPRQKLLPDFSRDIVNLASIGFDPHFFLAIKITNLIIKEVQAGLDGVGHKTPNALALAEWRALLQTAVYEHLSKGANWATDGANVLTVANNMGTIAGLLAGSNTEAGQDQLKSAFAATKFHTTCAAGSGGIGGGAWCSFDWF